MADHQPRPRFCSFCGGHLRRPDATGERPMCDRCGTFQQTGPAVLVLAVVFAEDRMLLMRRGTPPYVGSWAPPGGFAEAGESLEAAAVREVEEEVGIRLDRAQMVPHAMLSLPELNQVCLGFIAILERLLPLTPCPPEALEARWFLEHEYPAAEVWGPAVNFDIARLYDRVRSGRFDFYQQTDDASRIISHGTQINYIWRRD